VDVETVEGEHGPVEDVDLLFPIVKWRTEPGRERFEVRPLFFRRRDEDGSTTLALPLYARQERKDSFLEVLLPSYFRWTRPDSDHLHLWPFWGRRIEGTRRTDWTLFPFFAWERDGDPERERWSVDAPFPLVRFGRDGDGRSVRLLPLLWHERAGREATTIAFPFWWTIRREGRSFDMQFPVHASWETEEGEGESWLLNGWVRHREGTRETTHVLWPLFSRSADPENDRWSVDAPFPLVHFGRDGDAASCRVLPIFWHQRSGERSETVAFPLWWSFRDGDGGFDTVFPFHASWRSGERSDGEAWLLNSFVRHRRGDETTRWILAPLAGWTERPDRWKAHLWPVLWLERGPESSRTHLWPLFGHERAGDETTISTLYPFFQVTRSEESYRVRAPFPIAEFSASGDRSRSRVTPLFDFERRGSRREGNLLLLLARWRSVEGRGEGGRDGAESEFRVLLKLFESTSKGGRETLALNPLFRHETNARGDAHWSCLFGLLARTREGASVRWRFLWFL